MMSVFRKPAAAAPRSPERQRLAEAIAALDEAGEKLRVAEETRERVQKLYRGSDALIEAARDNLKAVTASAAASAADAVVAGADPDMAPIANARGAVEAAKDRQAALKLAWPGLATAVEDAGQQVRLKRLARDELACEIAAPAFERLFRLWIEHETVASQLHSFLVYLKPNIRAARIDGGLWDHYSRMLNAEVTLRMIRPDPPANFVEIVPVDTKAFRIAASRLFVDPDAPLPTLGGAAAARDDKAA